MTSPLDRVVVVLVRTHSAGNVGSVARLCGNYGTRLRLVAPACSPMSREARMFAAGQLRPLDEMEIVATLPEALHDVDVAVGTSSKLLSATEAPALDTDSARRLLPPDDQRVALVFGNEREGLTIDEGACCHRVLRLHTPGWHNSLNLSHAVGAVLALLTAATSTTTPPPSLSPRARERLIDDWLGLLDGAGYFRSTSPRDFRVRLARLVDDMDVDDRDAALLQGMLRALANAPPSEPT
jgi:tRNA (cytidine32/uridine32-2'-O)-methyltransferase